MDFYKGRVLRIDLSAGTSTVEPLNMEWANATWAARGCCCGISGRRYLRVSTRGRRRIQSS